MRRNHLLTVLSVSTLVITAAASACGDSGTSDGGGGSSSSTTSTATKASSSTTTGGMTTTTTTSTSTAASTTVASSSSTGGGMAGDHLLISEIAVEFVEIWNPTNAAVALDDYYLSDNATYVDLASGAAWNPTTSTAGTDFLARFPAGTTIPADGVIVIGFDPGYSTSYPNLCPDFFMAPAAVACGGNMIPALDATEPGSTPDTATLFNAREMLVLFTWDGNTTHTLKDVDYVTWGNMFEAGSRADKTNIAGYLPDTAVGMQKGAPVLVLMQSIERCSSDSSEKLTGGNGITGHDETSEDLTSSFVNQATPSPGTKNSCL